MRLNKAQDRWSFIPMPMIRNLLTRLDFLLQDVAYQILVDRKNAAPRPVDPVRSTGEVPVWRLPGSLAS